VIKSRSRKLELLSRFRLQPSQLVYTRLVSHRALPTGPSFLILSLDLLQVYAERVNLLKFLGLVLVVIAFTGCAPSPCESPKKADSQYQLEIDSLIESEQRYLKRATDLAISFWSLEFDRRPYRGGRILPDECVGWRGTAPNSYVNCLEDAKNNYESLRLLGSVQAQIRVMLDKQSVLLTTFPECFDASRVVDAHQRVQSVE